MEEIRVHDYDRTPASWTEIVRDGQFVAFSQFLDGGASCDWRGHAFRSETDATCLLFDGLVEARAFCDASVHQAPTVRFDIFDAAGRVNPPLLVIVHPARVASLDGNPRGIRIRRRSAIALVAGSVPLFWYDYSTSGGLLILPTIIGINMILGAARLLQLNAAYADAERRRAERLGDVTRSVRL